MLDPLLRMGVEGIRLGLIRYPALDVLILHLLDDLNGIVGHGMQGSHNRPILHWPCRANEGQEVREVRDSEPKVTLGAPRPLLSKIDAIFTNKREAWLVRDVEACGAYHCVYFALRAIFADYLQSDGDWVSMRLTHHQRARPMGGPTLSSVQRTTGVKCTSTLSVWMAAMYGSPGVMRRHPMPNFGVKPFNLQRVGSVVSK